MLDGVGGHTFQDFRRIITHHVVGLAVDIHLETAAAVHLDVVFAVHRYKGYFAQHLKNRVRLGIGVVLHVIFYLVDICLYQRLLGYNLHLSQLIGSICNIHGTEVHRLFSRFYGEVLHNTVPSHRRNCHNEVAFITGYFLLEVSLHIRHQHFQRMFRRFFLNYFDCSVRLAFFSKRIE